jgi:Lipocalin-like domain
MRAKLLVAVTVATVLSASAWAQTADDLRGTWALVSSVTDKDGTKTEQFGHGAKGMMSLDAGGHFMLTIIGPGLPKFAANSRAAGTAEENKAVMSKSIGMIGTYSVNPGDKTLTFKVESATFPNWNGSEQKRLIVTASKDELKYITPTASSGGVGAVTWKRAQ